MNNLNSSEVTAAVIAAFSGVSLGGGCSLRSAEEADHWGRPPFTNPEAFSDVDIINDWTALSTETLDHFPYLAHMDAEGFRYYIPAFMLNLIRDYEPSSMRVICTLGALYPKRDELWDYHMGLYSLLSREQSRAIAYYLQELPSLLGLGHDEQKISERALRNYWHEFL